MRAGKESRRSGTVEPLALTIIRGEDSGLTLTLRYSYEGKPPSFGERTTMVAVLLREVLDLLQGGEVADTGFSEDALRRVRTDRMEL
ncbi:hypothetical protein Rxyl_2264 [Rubrobacter xylanophilus DSM 9941]|uniref:Uncharacterized protein n=1 Tax=Rubrobacter xylanophilus (strain DSM 9941 / JCM 11954 / NBRC 16129 / PRD-1) TaxID=266117 RepID=Q1ATT4_RUBXD|nr:hypothetical protein [Rubrobacter xylanophilus]ABG05194.1 hypothetical protein Rxyl_2264 [Rubrobacter xylanophilus DSM 9941]